MEESPENVRPTFEPEDAQVKERRKKGNRKTSENRQTVGPETTQSRIEDSQAHPSEYTGNNYLDDMDNNSMFNASQSVIDPQKSMLEQPHLSIDIALGD